LTRGQYFTHGSVFERLLAEDHQFVLRKFLFGNPWHHMRSSHPRRPHWSSPMFEGRPTGFGTRRAASFGSAGDARSQTSALPPGARHTVEEGGGGVGSSRYLRTALRCHAIGPGGTHPCIGHCLSNFFSGWEQLHWHQLEAFEKQWPCHQKDRCDTFEVYAADPNTAAGKEINYVITREGWEGPPG